MEKKNGTDDCHNRQFLDERAVQRVDRPSDELGPVIDRDDLDTIRQTGFERVQPRLDRVDCGLRIGALAHHDDASHHLALAIELGDSSP